MNTPDIWKWEALPDGFWTPKFESSCEFFEIERLPDLSLRVTGKAYSLPPRKDDKYEAVVPGQLVKCETLELEQYGLHKVTCIKAFRYNTVRRTSVGEPAQFTQKWSCSAIETVWDNSKASHIVEWVLNLSVRNWFTRGTEYEHPESYVRSRSGTEWKLINRGGDKFVTDHFNISISIENECFVVNVGKSDNGPPEWKPGFIEYVGTTPDLDTRNTIRKALSFALGGELSLVSTTWFDNIGNRTKSRYESVSLSRVKGAVDSGFELMTSISGVHPEFSYLRVDERKIERLVQGLIDADDLLRIDELSRFYFLARRTVLDIRPVLYGSSLEYIRDCIKSELPTTLIRKKAYKEHIRPALEATLQEVVEDEMLQPGATIDDLLHKFSYFHNTSLSAQARELMSYLNLEFGQVEKTAIHERHHGAHGRTYQREHYDTLIQHVRAFQTLINRLILAATNGADTYIDYSSDGFPERPLAEPLGGPNGDGKPAVYPNNDDSKR